jgi:hypothetical protein
MASLPGLLLLETAQDVFILGVELNLILVQVVGGIVGTDNLGNLDQLVRVALAVEEGLLAEDHGRKHGTQTPSMQAVVIFLEVHQQLGSLKVPGGNGACYLSVLIFDHNVMRHHISVHTLAVTVVESLVQLEDVATNINIGKLFYLGF